MPIRYALKLGDRKPSLDVVLKDGDGVASDLTDVTELVCQVRRADTKVAVVERTATIVDISNQLVADPTRGLVQVAWAAGDSDAMAVGSMEAEFSGLINSQGVTWPSEGYVPFEVWTEIAAPES